jgi:hypothetical protein
MFSRCPVGFSEPRSWRGFRDIVHEAMKDIISIDQEKTIRAKCDFNHGIQAGGSQFPIAEL